MKILQLTKKFPFPTKDGESLAIVSLARAYAEAGHETHLLAMNTAKHRFDFDPARPPAALGFYASIEAIDVDNRIRPAAALANHFFSKKSHHVERHESPNFKKALEKALDQVDFDVVQFETIYLAAFAETIAHRSKALIALRSHNIEHEIWARIAEREPLFLKKKYLQNQSARLAAFEKKALRSVDCLLGISEKDIEALMKMGFVGPSVLVPIGLDSSRYEPDFSVFGQKKSAAFLGSLDWAPNAEGLDWFLNAVWRPFLRPRFDDANLRIAGRNMPNRFSKMNEPGIEPLGEIESAPDFLNASPVLVAPILSGSGMRAKILEGMAMGRAVVTTSVGLEGIAATDGQEALIADDPRLFAEKIAFCFENPAKALAIGQRARAFFEANFDSRAVAERALELFGKLSERR